MKIIDFIKGLAGGGTKSSKGKKSSSKAKSTPSRAKQGGSSSKSKPTSRSKSKNSKASNSNITAKKKQEFPKKFPFWARFKPSKNRTTLVIDEEMVKDKRSGKIVEGFVHRESIHTEKKDYEKIYPNPDKDDPKPMYLKRPTKRPKREFKPHNKNLDMPQSLQERYEKNNKKKS